MVPVTHVLYLSDVPGRPPLSGAERHVVVLLEAMAARGVPIELVAMLWSGSDFGCVDEVLAGLVDAGVSVTRIERWQAPGTRPVRHKASMVAAWFRLAKVLRSRRGGIVHLHLDLVFTPVIARLAGCRLLVVSVHNDEPVYGSRRWQAWWRVLRALPVRLIAITQHVNDYVQGEGGWPAGRIITVYYGIDAPAAEPLTRRELGLPEDGYVVGFVGRLTLQKNLPVLLDVLAQRPDIYGVFVGAGPLRDELQAAAPANATFLGAIPDGPRAMPAFDLFCLPSRWEGLGLVLVEAMLQGVPIVASNCGAIAEVLGDGAYGTLGEPTVESIGAGIDAARRDPAAMAERAERARRWAADRFSVVAMVDATLGVYARAQGDRR